MRTLLAGGSGGTYVVRSLGASEEKGGRDNIFVAVQIKHGEWVGRSGRPGAHICIAAKERRMDGKYEMRDPPWKGIWICEKVKLHGP